VTLDEDLAHRIDARMRERGSTFKETINDLIRRGLAAGEPDRSYVVPVFDSPIRRGVDLTKALALASAMEDDEVVRKMELGK
jgi:hypothetical protein